MLNVYIRLQVVRLKGICSTKVKREAGCLVGASPGCIPSAFRDASLVLSPGAPPGCIPSAPPGPLLGAQLSSSARPCRSTGCCLPAIHKLPKTPEGCAFHFWKHFHGRYRHKSRRRPWSLLHEEEGAGSGPCTVSLQHIETRPWALAYGPGSVFPERQLLLWPGGNSPQGVLLLTLNISDLQVLFFEPQTKT